MCQTFNVGDLIIPKSYKYVVGRILEIKDGKYLIDQSWYGILEIELPELLYYFTKE